MPERVEVARGLLDRDRAAPSLDELHEPVGRVEAELHGAMLGEHMFVRKRKEKAAAHGLFRVGRKDSPA